MYQNLRKYSALKYEIETVCYFHSKKEKNKKIIRIKNILKYNFMLKM